MGFTQKTDRLNEVWERKLNEDSTKDALGTLNAIIKSTQDDKDNDIYKMAIGMKKSYEKNKGFSPDQAKWIYNTSKALFK